MDWAMPLGDQRTFGGGEPGAILGNGEKNEMSKWYTG